MLVSMMERADRAGAVPHSLLINHRAYGGLQQLASSMFYNMKMISGHSDDEVFPPSVQHLQRYLERFLDPGQTCREPRLIAFSPRRGEVKVGTSWANQNHGTWVMDRVTELLQDQAFRQVGRTDRGTILIIAPYKEAYLRYKKSIKSLPSTFQARLGVEARLEARTIDTVQGGEADFVFLDLVRSSATDFTDDPNRLCVALTRARQAEVILMHPGSELAFFATLKYGLFDQYDRKLTLHTSVRRGTQYLCQIFAHCERLRQVVSIEKSPKQLAAIPNEAKALEQDAARRPAIERERAMLGLEPRIEAASSIDSTCSLADRADPESIYASQFSSMAKIMEDILESNKKNRASEARSPCHVSRPDNTQPRPAKTPTCQNDIESHMGGSHETIRIFNPAEDGVSPPQRTTNSNTPMPDLSQDDIVPDGASYGGPSDGSLPIGGRSDINEPGLGNSRWVTPEQRISAQPHPPTLQRGHGLASGPNGQYPSRAVAQAQTLGQPGNSIPRSSVSAETSGRVTARPVAAAKGRERDREDPNSLPAGQSWW